MEQRKNKTNLRQKKFLVSHKLVDQSTLLTARGRLVVVVLIRYEGSKGKVPMVAGRVAFLSGTTPIPTGDFSLECKEQVLVSREI